jgi:hypothetical protein
MMPGYPNIFGRTPWPRFAGWSTIVVDQRIVGGVREWFVNGQGSFRRINSQAFVLLPPGSQFYNKTAVHEAKHVYQFNVDPRWSTYFDATDLYDSVLRTLTSRTDEADLRRQILSYVHNRTLDDQMSLELARQITELEAHAADRAVEPHYLEVSDAEVRLMYP